MPYLHADVDLEKHGVLRTESADERFADIDRAPASPPQSHHGSVCIVVQSNGLRIAGNIKGTCEEKLYAYMRMSASADTISVYMYNSNLLRRQLNATDITTPPYTRQVRIERTFGTLASTIAMLRMRIYYSALIIRLRLKTWLHNQHLHHAHSTGAEPAKPFSSTPPTSYYRANIATNF